MSNITNDISVVMGCIGLLLTGTFRNFFTATFLVGVMFIMNWKLALVAFTAFPFGAYPLYSLSRKMKHLVTRLQFGMEEMTMQVDDSLRSVRVVKAYNAENFELTRFDKILRSIYENSRLISKVTSIQSPFVQSLTGIGVGLVLWYGGSKVASGETTPGTFFSFFTAMMMAYKPIKGVAGYNTSLQMGINVAKKLFVILDYKPKVKEEPDAIELNDVKGNIELNNVNFAYFPDVPVLKDLNIKLEAGKNYSLVGHSGSGKSTIMNLLLRFYDVNSGEIKLDGHDIRNLKIHSLRKAFSYVGQEVQLFDDTIKANIVYGNQNATDEDAINAAKMAEAHDFIMALPEGYETKIGQNGNRLSGGQRQRISIARAFLYNSPILLLDEATSSLDPISDSLIQKAIDKLTEQRTTLTIAHKIHTVVKADKIFVMAHGELIASGSHKELMESSEAYRILFRTDLEG